MHNPTPIRVTIWNEFQHERNQPAVKELYPDGIHSVIREGLLDCLGDSVEIQCATLDQPEHGLTQEVLDQTEVLYWWGHAAHEEVSDEVVHRVRRRVLDGMGLVVLHSGHYSKIFRSLMGTECMLRWRDRGEKERLWVVSPGHPILRGIEAPYFELPESEMYGEHFDIPKPDELLLISWFEGGEVFRSGCTFQRGQGKIFYFGPGHETFPIYFDHNVKTILANAAVWARTQAGCYSYDHRPIPDPLEEMDQADG